MKIGFVGLGKLGLPVAAAIASRGFEVLGYDPVAPNVNAREVGIGGVPFRDLCSSPFLNFVPALKDAVDVDLVFVAVQTPHDDAFNGETLLKKFPEDFNYQFLIKALNDIGALLNKPTPVAVISTMLPGTFTRIIDGLWNGENIRAVYHPLFIGMGSAVSDFLDPEFVVMGWRDDVALETLREFYAKLFQDSKKPINYRTMTPESAELVKCAYNTFISQKITFANTLMEICHNIPHANVDYVTRTLQSATERLVSPRYMTAGMGDGGGCHPRENVALSYLAKKFNLSHDPFKSMIEAREQQAGFLADQCVYYSENHFEGDALPIVVLGYAFKPGTDLTAGSPALLVGDILSEKYERQAYFIDAHVQDEPIVDYSETSVFLIGCKHPEYVYYKFPQGSVVIDPHRYIPDQENVTVIRVGE